jgi:hypothetical protein
MLHTKTPIHQCTNAPMHQWSVAGHYRHHQRAIHTCSSSVACAKFGSVKFVACVKAHERYNGTTAQCRHHARHRHAAVAVNAMYIPLAMQWLSARLCQSPVLPTNLATKVSRCGLLPARRHAVEACASLRETRRMRHWQGWTRRCASSRPPAGGAVAHASTLPCHAPVPSEAPERCLMSVCDASCHRSSNRYKTRTKRQPVA